ncbi:unnamed protein product [Didymodactylos carnosus]|uniref:Uncharacterized protein n=1 Tax=Didymodactylos carnosus TaxID=1234261 RepID=A0A8S2DKC6_9BILA|nr:unnamed protein product [Didymodactylos carnosus]CAF3706328.1 unnamed protein product [Didymodactylos carnosus]
MVSADEHVDLRQTLQVRNAIQDLENANIGEIGWICNRGIAVLKKNDVNNNKTVCFCPPSLYGKYCQYFSDRITIIVSLSNIPQQLLEQKSSVTIKILCLLLIDEDILDYHDFHLPLILTNDHDKKFRFSFVYSRPKITSSNYKVRFEAYLLNHKVSTLTNKFLGVWQYPVHFNFLPSYRLAKILKFENQGLLVNHTCQKANPCLSNSICYPIMNRINDTSAYYCYCNSNSYGKHCEHLSSLPNDCSTKALHRSLSQAKSICLCSISHFGPTCHLNHTCVNKNPCNGGNDRGKCHVNSDNLTRDYFCVCDKKYFGDHCQYESATVNILFTDLSFIQIPPNWIIATVIQLCDLDNETLDLIVLEKRVYQGEPPHLTQVVHNHHYLPMLGIMKLYHKQELTNGFVANLKEPEYFLLYIISSNTSNMNLTSAIHVTNYCTHTLTVFQKNLTNINYLASGKYGRAECSRYDSKVDECSGADRCLAGGQCVHGDPNDRNDFVCLCPPCYYGSICQHNTKLFSFTLETLVTKELVSPSIIVQRLFFSILLTVSIILLLIGFANNVCCYITFKRKKPLQFGIAHYLLASSIINQLTLLMLLLKLMHIILSTKGYVVHYLLNTVLCKSLSYLLSCFSRMSYWLTGMAAIQRLYVTWSLTGQWLKSPRIAKRTIFVIIFGVLVCNAHEAIFYNSTEDPKYLTSGTWCVTSYPPLVSTFNQVNVVLNYTVPFVINLLSTTTIIGLIARKRAAATTRRSNQLTPKPSKSCYRVYIDLLIENQELILAPTMTMVPQLFMLPQFILSLTLACQEFKVDWQRYLLIISYFIAYLPQVLSYKLYISPSSFYKNEFYSTNLGKKLKGWLTTKRIDKA